jgi:hypothetical protein
MKLTGKKKGGSKTYNLQCVILISLTGVSGRLRF